MENEDDENEALEINGQTINYKKSTVDHIKQDFINLNETDREFINYSLGDADDLLKMISDNKKNITNYTANDLDELLFLWINKKFDFKYFDENQLINAVGAAFGNCLNNELNTIWSIVSDEYGTDYCCLTTDEYKFQLFPFSSVLKAVEQKREGSLEGIVLIVKENIKQLKENKNIEG